MSGGTITRKDLITDEGLEFGKEYAKNIQLAIEANNELVDSAKALAQVATAYQKANNSQAFITAKNEEKLALQRVENAIKAEELALKSAEKIKQESLRTKKLELDALSKEEAAKKRNTKLSIEERVQNEINNRILKQATLEKLGLVSAYDKLNRARTEAKNKLRDLIATENASTEAIKKAQAEFDKLDAKVKRADKAVGDFTKNVGNYPKLNQFNAGLRDLAGAFGIVAGTAAFASVVKGAVKIIREYEAEIVNLAAVAGKTRDQIKPLEDQIRTVAKTSINGATDIAKLASELIKLGSTEDEVIALLKPIDDLSVALRTTAEDSASLVKGLLNAYGEGADQAARYTDVLAAAANKTSLDFNGLRDSLSYLAPVAKSLNLSLEETTSIIGVLADNNIKAESAGRLMATSFTRLATNGMTLDNALDQVNKKQAEGADNLEILALAGKLFGAESAKLALILANNRDKMANLNQEFENSRGSLEELTNKQLQSLDARLKQVDSAWEDFVLSIEDGQGALGGFVSDWLKGFSMLLDGLTRLNTSWDELQDKAEQAGKAEGIKKFQESVTNYTKAGVEQNEALGITIKQAQIELAKFQKELDTAQSKIKEYEKQNTVAKIFGGGYDMIAFYNEEIERLRGAIGQRSAIINAANEKLNKTTEDNAVESEKKVTKLTEEEQKKRQSEAEKARKDYLARMKKLDDDAFALAKFRMEQEIEISNEISENESELVQDRIDAYLNAQQVEQSLLQESAAYKLRQISQYNDQVRDLTNNEINILINGGEIKKKLTDDEILIIEEFQAKKSALDKKDLENRQRIIDSIVAIEQKKTDKVLQQQDTELNKRLEAENKLFAENLKLLEDNQAEIEALTLRHEEEVFNIKKEYAKKALTEQINALQTLLDAEAKKPEAERISADKIAEIQNKLSKYRLQLSEEDLKNSEATANKMVQLEAEAVALIKELQAELYSTMKDLVFALFDAKIQKIDEDIQANDEYYAQQLEMAEGDAAQQALIEQERDKKRKALERERRKEEFKAAVAKKVISTAEIAVDLARTLVAINLAAAQMDALIPFSGVPYRAIQIPLAIGVAAAQTALVLAQPLPKYEKGTQGKPHKGGFAEVGEKRPEVILEPGKNPYIVEKPSILNLPKGTEVIPSINEWERMQRASIMASLDMEANKAKNYQGAEVFNARYDAELLEELRRNTEATKKNKSNVVVQNNIDLGHEIWKLSNIKWGA